MTVAEGDGAGRAGIKGVGAGREGARPEDAKPEDAKFAADPASRERLRFIPILRDASRRPRPLVLAQECGDRTVAARPKT